MANTQSKQSARSPIATLISDIHFDIGTLSAASSALEQAVTEANRLGIQLIVAGDLHNSKANIRGECVKAIMDILEKCRKKAFVIVANHDRINEKSPAHSLEFLRSISCLVTKPLSVKLNNKDLILVPYYHDTNELRAFLKIVPKGSTIIMHQGLEGSDAGEYIQDKSAVTHEDVKDFRVISGHYHRRQDIKTGRPQKGAGGVFSYIGNPFTLGFGEADHPEKGFQILMDDGTLEFVPTNLRKHVIIERRFEDLIELDYHFCRPEDLVWIKITGTREQLATITKQYVKDNSGIKNFRLDLIPTDSAPTTKFIKKDMSQGQALDAIIDSLPDSPELKARLKDLWRKSVSN